MKYNFDCCDITCTYNSCNCPGCDEYSDCEFCLHYDPFNLFGSSSECDHCVHRLDNT